MFSRHMNGKSSMSSAKCVRTAFAVVIIVVGIVWSIMFPKTGDILRPDFVASVALGAGLIVTGLLILFMTKSRAVPIVLLILLLWSVLCNICLCVEVRGLHQLSLGLLEAERLSARRNLRILESGEEGSIERLADLLRRVAGQEYENHPISDDATEEADVGLVDPNAVAYVSVCKPPSGFWLRKASLVEVIPEGMFASVWRKEAGRNKLGTPVVEKLRTKKGTKYGNVIEEHWNRGRDRLDFRKLICPDKETFDATVDLMLHSYAEAHVETQEPLVGERTWIIKKPERHVVSLFASEGLILVRVRVSCASTGIEDIEGLTKNIAAKALSEPWSVQEAQLNKRIEAHINRVGQLHKFDTWRGKTKIADKQVDSLSSFEEGFFKTFSSKLEMLTPKRERDRVLSVRLLGVSSGTDVYVEIEAANSAVAAHERMIRDVALASATSNFKISEPNDPNDPLNIGDICFGFVPSWVRMDKGIPIPRELFFCRNNVFVRLRSALGAPAEKYPDLRPIALLVDTRLELEMLSNPK